MLRAWLSIVVRRLASRPVLGSHLLSMAAHTALIVGLSWIVVAREGATPSGGMCAEWEGERQVVQPAALDAASTPVAIVSEALGTAAGMGPVAGALADVPLVDFPADVAYRGQHGGQRELDFGALADQELPVDESAARGDASFFGVTAKGRSFVFIVDMSLSMAADGRFQRAKAELKRSIEALAPEKTFFVIFYNDQTWPMPAEWLVPATARNVQDVAKWFKRVHPNGGTDPLAAVRMAVEMRSDAIFLLTDGEFSDDVARYLDWGRTSDRTPIHTIAFTSRVGEPLLKAIARMTGGTYRHVR